MEVVYLRIFRLDYHSDFIFSLTKDYKVQEELKRQIRTITCDLIEQKKEQLGYQLETEGLC